MRHIRSEPLAQEDVAGRAALHEPVSHHCAVVGDGVPGILRMLMPRTLNPKHPKPYWDLGDVDA